MAHEEQRLEQRKQSQIPIQVHSQPQTHTQIYLETNLGEPQVQNQMSTSTPNPNFTQIPTLLKSNPQP